MKDEGNEVGSVYKYTPSLVFSHGKDSKMNTLCGVSKNNHHHPHFIPQLCEKKIWRSYLDWLVLEDKRTSEFCVMNIGSMEKVNLPNLDSSNLITVHLSSEPDDPQCRIICICKTMGKYVIMLCKQGDTEFSIQEWQSEQYIRDSTFFNGKFYCLVGYTLFVADVLGPTSNTKLQFKNVMGERLPRPPRPEFPGSSKYLIDAEKELLFVDKINFLSGEVYSLRVFRVDFYSMTWVEVDCIGNQTIFLSEGQGICLSAEMGGTRPNCIYFTQSDDRRLYVFDLEDRSFSSSLPCGIISEKEVDSIWIMIKYLHFSSKSILGEGISCTNTRLELVEGSCYQNNIEHEDTQRPSWSDLLPELLSSILSRLFMSDYVTFRIICKSWHSTCTLPPQLLQTPDPSRYKHPYLLFLNTETRLFNFHNPIYNATYQSDIPEIHNACIRFSKDRWLIMSLGTKVLFLFNPFTKTRIELPDIPLEYGFSRMCFFASPNSPDFKVFGFSDEYNDRMEICTIKLGEKEWSHDVFDYDIFEFRFAGCSPIIYDGLVYLLGDTGDLVIYSGTSNDDSSWSMWIKAREKFKNSELRYLVESEGEIFLVLVRRGGEKVDVLKLDSETTSWNDVESLGDKMLFVSLKSSSSGRAEIRGAGNKVYFPRLHGNRGVFYSLKTRKFHSINFTGSCPNIESCQESETKQLVWI